MIREWLLKWLGVDTLDLRVKDIEKHFVTKRNELGQPIETLADVPLEQRKERQVSQRGMSLSQRRAYLEATDGGRRLNG